MKKLGCILCIAVLFCSCDMAEPNSNHDFKDIIPLELGSLQKILEGYIVNSIAFDSKGNAWIGTQGQGVIRHNEKEIIVFNSSNSNLPKDLWIWDIAVDQKDNVWIASDGVWKYDGQSFTLYNSQNTAMPEDIVWSIAVDSKNNLWMASCRFNQGGLVKYDGTKWTPYTPKNSALPANSIRGIAIDQSDNVWLALSDYVNKTCLVKISNDKWHLYGEKELGFKPYYLGGIQCDSKNRLWAAIDYSLSSAMISAAPHFFVFDGKNTTQLSCGDDMRISSPRSGITIDRNDHVWCYGMGSTCGVWVGKEWIPLDSSKFDGSSVWVIKEGPNNRLWFGTENGIYVEKR
jgi:ligand-binding sensor domain-containing protein